MPEIEAFTEDLDLVTSDSLLSFRIHAWDNRFLLNRINVWINGTPLYGKQGMTLKSKKVNNFNEEIELELSAGKNKIQISCMNEKGMESLKETFEINCLRENVSPDFYILSIGVSDYENDDFDLSFAAKDATDLVNLFTKYKYKTDYFAKVNHLLITDQEAIRTNILNAKDFLKKAKVDDQIVVFISGHGLLDEKLDFYFGTYNIDFENPSMNGVSYDEIENLLDGIECRNRLMFMDACHSGEVDKEETILAMVDDVEDGVKGQAFKMKSGGQIFLGLDNSFELMKGLFADLRRGSGATVISSASGVQYSYEKDGFNNGLFTYCLLHGIKSKKADLNRDRAITVSELKQYVEESVTILTRGKQTPTSRQVNLENDYRVW